MKLLTLFTLLSFACVAQQKTYTIQDTNMRIDSITGGMIYTDVIRVDSASASQLYSRAKTFLLKAFTNESAVTQIEDKEGGMVGGRGKFSMKLSTGTALLTGQLSMYYEMAIEIRVKDGRYRYEFSNIEVVNHGTRIKVDDQIRKNPKQAQKLINKGFSQKEYDQYMGVDKNPIQAIIADLKRTMSPGKNNKNNF